MGNHNVRKGGFLGEARRKKNWKTMMFIRCAIYWYLHINMNLHMKAQKKMGKMERKVRDTVILFKW